jgi:CHAD domain-containing protein
MRIDFSRPISEELRRIIEEQVAFARDCLGGIIGPNSEDEVHELRKTTKKLRAILRATASELPRGVRRDQIAAWRQVASALAIDRDLAVTEQWLKVAYSELLPDADPSTKPWRGLSLFDSAFAMGTGAGTIPSREQIRQLIDDAAATLSAIDWSGLDFDRVLSGTMRTYRQGRRLLDRVRAHAAPEDLHDLRKRAKDQLYQLRTLVSLCPSALRHEAMQFEQLADTLGEHHDLCNLSSAILASRSSFRQLKELPGLLEWVGKRTRALELEALALAKAVYSTPRRDRARNFRALYHEAIQHSPRTPSTASDPGT